MQVFFRLFLTFICITATNSLFGQYLVGPKVSYVLSQVAPGKNIASDIGTSKLRGGYSFGGTLNFEMTKLHSLHTELNFTYKTRAITDLKGTLITYNNRHLDLPVLFRLSFIKKMKQQEDYRIYVNAGPEISYWLSGRGHLEGVVNDSTFRQNFKIHFNDKASGDQALVLQDANRFQLGVSFGAGLIIPMLYKQILMLDIRYHIGQTFLGKEFETTLDSYTLSDNLKGNYRVFSLSAAYLFNTNLGLSKRGKSTIKIKTRNVRR